MNKKIKEKLNIKNSLNRMKKGMGLVEVLVAVFIFTIILSSLILVSNMYLSGAGDNLRLTQAAYLAEEGVEAVKTIRDNSWTNISAMATGTKYYLATTSSAWATTTTKVYIDNFFLRYFILEDAMRDNNSRDILDTGTIVDSKTRKLTVFVSWLGKTGTTTKSLKTYITDIVGE
jgi:type II secretory pathway pseudopilin PulG